MVFLFLKFYKKTARYRLIVIMKTLQWFARVRIQPDSRHTKCHGIVRKDLESLTVWVRVHQINLLAVVVEGIAVPSNWRVVLRQTENILYGVIVASNTKIPNRWSVFESRHAAQHPLIRVGCTNAVLHPPLPVAADIWI